MTNTNFLQIGNMVACGHCQPDKFSAVLPCNCNCHKVLFLDIDGVVNSEETFTKNPKAFFPIDAYMAFLVGRIQIATGCSVILSSSWRHHPESVEHIRNHVVELIGTTPDSCTKERSLRGYEIQDWLDEHPTVTRYAILDDDVDMLEEQLPNFFKTDWKIGLTDEIAMKIINHLNNNNAA